MKSSLIKSILALSLILTACSKEAETSQEIDTAELQQMATEQIITEQILNDFDLFTEDEGQNELTSYKTNSCLSITRDTTVRPARIIFDFGPVNCMGPDSNMRRGQLILS